jgi:cytochrome c oxidase subunit 1
MVNTIFIALPSAIKVFNWISTVWGGKIEFTTPMLNALAFVALFIIGGLSGIFMASTPTDIHFHDTYFIVAHIHYVLFGGTLFGIFAGIYFWFPKMFGRQMNETWGKVHFTLTFITYNIAFYLMHILGIMGAPRRYEDLRPHVAEDMVGPTQTLNIIISHSVFILIASQSIFAVNFFYSLFFGPRVGRNPWKSNSLEWHASSPPPHGNFEQVPIVYHGPYEYSHPEVEEDYLPQTQKTENALTTAHHH